MQLFNIIQKFLSNKQQILQNQKLANDVREQSIHTDEKGIKTKYASCIYVPRADIWVADEYGNLITINNLQKDAQEYRSEKTQKALQLSDLKYHDTIKDKIRAEHAWSGIGDTRCNKCQIKFRQCNEILAAVNDFLKENEDPESLYRGALCRDSKYPFIEDNNLQSQHKKLVDAIQDEINKIQNSKCWLCDGKDEHCIECKNGINDYKTLAKLQNILGTLSESVKELEKE